MSDPVATIQELRTQLAACKADSQRAARIQSALYEIADAASAATDMQSFYVTLQGIIARLMYARNFLIATYEEKSGILSFPYHVDEKEVEDESWLPEVYKENKGATSYVMRTGKSLHTSTQNAKLIKSGELEIIGTEPEDGIFVALKADGKMLGAVAVQSYSKGIGYSEDDVQVLTFVGQHVSTALTRARALEEVRQRNNELAILNSVGEAMSKTLDVKNVVRIVGDTVRDIFNADAIAIYLLDDQSNIIHPAYVFDKGEGGYIDYVPPFPLGKGLTSIVIQSRKPLMLGTVEEQEANGGFLAPEVEEKGSGISTESWLAVPILAGDRVLGIVNVSEYRAHAYNESHVRLLETLSANMGVAIENARLFEAEQQRSNELAILNSVGEAMSKTMDVKTMTRIVGDKVRDIFNADGVSIMLLDSTTNLIHTHYEFDKGEGGYIDYIEPFPLGKGLTTKVIKSRQPLLLNTLEEQGTHGGYIAPESIERGSGITAQSWLGVPITVGERVLGVTTITNYRPRAFDKAHQRLLETLASNMGVAIENARLFEAEKQRAGELAIINSVQEGLASKLDYEAIVDLVGEKIREIFDAQSISIGRYDHANGLVDYSYLVQRGRRVQTEPSPFAGMSKYMIDSRQTLELNENVEKWGAEHGVEWGTDFDIPRSAIYVPLLVGKTVTGVITIANLDRENAFRPSDVSLLETLTSSMSVALENARLFDETQRLFKAEQQRAAELAIINSVQEGLASKLDMQAIYDLVGDKLHETFPEAQTVDLLTYDKTIGLLNPRYAIEKGKRYEIEPWRAIGFRKYVIETGKTMVINHDMERLAAEFSNPVIVGEMAKSAVFVPMIVGGEVLGVMSLQHIDREEAFSDSDVRLLETLASSMSVALENARLFEETERLFKAEQQRAAELAIINSVQEGLASKLDYQAIIDLVGDQVRETFKADTTYIFLYERETKLIRRPYYVERGYRHNLDPLAFGEGLTSIVIKKRQPLLLGTNEESDNVAAPNSDIVLPEQEKDLNETYLGVPIMAGDEVMGVASVQSYKQHAYNEADVRLLQTLANSMSVALENARLFDETQRLFKAEQQRAAELAIITSVQQGLASKLEMQGIYDLVGEKIRTVFDAQVVSIMTLDTSSNLLTDRYAFEKGDLTLLEAPVPLFGFRKHVVETREALVINKDIEQAGIEFGNPILYGAMPKSSLFVPMIAGKEVTGIISLQNLDHEDAFSDSDVRLLQTLASSMSVALENARLFDETQRLYKAEQQRAAELSVINSVQKGLASKLDMQAIYDLVGNKIRDIFKTEVVYIAIRDTGRAEQFDFPYYLDRGNRLVVEPVTLGEGITSRVVETQQPVVAGTMERQRELGGIYDDEEQSQSYLGVPIFLGDKVMGVASVQSYQANTFGDADVRLLSTLAASMGVALENARLFDEVQKRNSEITEALEQQTATSDILRVIAGSPTDIQPVLEVIAVHAMKLCDGMNSSVYLTDGAQVFEAVTRDASPDAVKLNRDEYPRPLTQESSLSSRAILGKKVLNISDSQNDPSLPELTRKYSKVLGMKSILFVPMLKEGEALGALAVSHAETGLFSGKQVALLQTFADQAVIAIENVRLFNETKRLLKETEQRAAELAIINSVQDGLATKLDIQAIYDLVGDKIRETFAADTTYIVAYNANEQSVYSHYYGEKGEHTPLGPIPFGPGLYTKVIRSRQPVVVATHEEGFEQGATNIPSPGGEADLNESGLYVPIMLRDEVKGVVSVQSHRQNAFGDNDLRLLTTLAGSMSVALENARLFDEVQSRNREISEALEQQTATSEVLSVIAGSPTDVRPVLDAVARSAAKLCEANDVQIYQVDGDQLRQVSHHGPLPALQDGEALPLVPGLLTGRAVLERRTIHTEDVSKLSIKEYPESVKLQERLGHKTTIVTPLLREDKAIGAIVVRRNVVQPFTDKQVGLLSTFADQAAIAIENVRLFNETTRLLKETEQRAAELAIINSVQEGLASKLEMQAIYDLVGDKIRDIFNAQSILIVTYDKASNISTFSYNYEKGVRDNPTPRPSSGITGHVIKTRQPILINDHYAERENQILGEPTEILAGEDIKARLDVPMLVGGEATGVISLQNIDRENAFSDSDLRLLQTLAASMSVALENARLFGETQRLLKETEQRAAELAIINSVQEGLASKLEMQAIYDLVGDKIRDIFHDMDLGIRIYDPATNIMHYPYTREKGQRIEIASEVENKKGFAWHVLETHQTMLINENMGKTMEAYGSYALPGTEMEKSLLMVPLMAGGQARGILSLLSMERENAFSDSDVRLLQTLAGSMSVALENARLFDETQRLLKETDQRAAELAIINGVQEGLASKLEMQAIYDLVGEKIRNVFDSQAVTIALYDRTAKMLRFPYYLHRSHRLPQEPIKFGEGLTSHLIRTRQPLLINNDAEKRYAELGAVFVTGDDNAKSWLGVPIVSGSEATGAIFLQNYERENAYSESDVRLLSTIATSMGVALENARLFDETQRLLKETDQRATELALINSVQEGLAAKLEEPAIYELVGDKIRDLHLNVDVGIRIFDRQTNLIHYPYLREKGKRIEIQPQPLRDTGFSAHVLRTRQTLVINENMAQTLEQYGSYVVPGTEMAKSAVYAPLFIGGQVEGIVSLGSFEREHAFSETDVRLLQTLAGSMGIALEKARLFEAEKQRAAELSAISTVSQALVAETELESMIQLIGNQLRDIFDADILYVALLNQQTNMIEFPYEFGQELGPIPMGEGLTSKIIETRQPILINQDIAKQVEEIGAKRVGKDARSYLGVPILSGRQAIGAISVQSTREENAFNEDDLRLLSTIAANAGAAIQTARLHSETQHHAQEMATLAEIGNDIASSRELEPVLKRIAAHAKNILHVRDIAIRLIDSDGETLTTSVALGTYTAEIKADVLRLGEGLTGAIAASGLAEFINEPTRDPRVRHVAGTPEEDDSRESMMVAPLISRGQTIGVISVWRPHENGLFTQQELDFLVSVARQTAIAIESARLYLETQRRANEMSALAEVGREISASLDPTVVLEKIATRAKDLLAGSSSAVFLINPDKKTMRTVTALGELASAFETDVIKLGEGIIGSLALEGKSEFVNGTGKDSRSVYIPGTEDEDNSHENLMAAPMFRGAEVTGMMAVWRMTTPFNETDLNFLNGLARQASSALENARLFEEIKAEKQYSEALVQNSPVAIVSIDVNGSVVEWNPGAEKLFGYPVEEAIGRHIDNLVAKDPAIRVQAEAYSKQAAQPEQIQTITQRTRKDGSLVDVELSGVPVIADGKRIGMLSIYHDITELQRARQEAIAANEAKSAFLATMSHEIRTPMNAVIGMSGLLMDTQLNKEQHDYAETIRNSGDALLAIINDILDFSKIEAGKMDLEHQPFDLRECVESALDLVAGRAVEKNIDLAYIIEDEVPTGIKGDVTRLRQILLNLLSNAVKFTEKGEVVLTVRKDATENGLRVSVRDSGIGIPADRMGRLFESFSQADSSTTRRFGGTGLGLVISKRLAEMMGGTMWVESAGAGKGSTFTFTMIAEPAKVAERKTARDIKGVQPSLQGKRVLIVDDNATNRRILMLQTEKWGMVPRETESPSQALKWLKADEPFDLAILDVQMPEMDGLMLTRELRKLRDAKALPIILLTSLGRKEVGAQDLDFAAYLLKPLKPSGLFDALASIFARNIVSPQLEPVKAIMDPEMGRTHPLRILLAEDNAVNQKLALRLLEQMGYRADIASNGLEAVESVERQPYDVILMDMQMPEMDGLDATRAIRKLQNVAQPRIVAMTANAMQGDRELCLAAGMDDYVSKPIRVPELVAALQHASSAEAEVIKPETTPRKNTIKNQTKTSKAARKATKPKTGGARKSTIQGAGRKSKSKDSQKAKRS